MVLSSENRLPHGGSTLESAVEAGWIHIGVLKDWSIESNSVAMRRSGEDTEVDRTDA